ncbi:16S rRNA (adenine(1518)-N(6)/adenine(1519)-N(6))-dimethyltransferase RsmA [Candidatus Pelagibacter sp.]|nr:16S rRNA (adenine(1518)-N(6)/adenine(1519)-N(6))-dimethyltransferase RsmA [Candidatus Pelagibacter sp.]
MKPKKSLGQNFLNDQRILSKIVELGCINHDDIILEIGPGKGSLTEKIIEKKPLKLIVVEKDKQLSNFVKKKFANNVEVINEDILKCYNHFRFEKPIKVFGNLPYNISTKILTSLISLTNVENVFSLFVFVFQKEVADRIVANYNSKQYGRLSILSSWKMEKSKILNINPKSFYPPPKVWSSLITLKPKKNYFKINKVKNLEHITNIFFNQRRKMIRKPMKQLFLNHESVAKDLNVDLNLRPQNLPVNKYLEICKFYENLI